MTVQRIFGRRADNATSFVPPRDAIPSERRPAGSSTPDTIPCAWNAPVQPLPTNRERAPDAEKPVLRGSVVRPLRPQSEPTAFDPDLADKVATFYKIKTAVYEALIESIDITQISKMSVEKRPCRSRGNRSVSRPTRVKSSR